MTTEPSLQRRSVSSIAVYCGSNRGVDPAYTAAASTMGALLAQRGINVVYGGGHVGLMGVLADAVVENGGTIHGVITHALEEREIAHGGLTRLDVVETMHERKAIMAREADAFLMLPGGIGTFEEFFEVATWTQLGIQSKPCGVLNVRGYFDPLVALLDKSTEQGFLRTEHRSIMLIDADPVAILDRLEQWSWETVNKWTDERHFDAGIIE